MKTAMIIKKYTVLAMLSLSAALTVSAADINYKGPANATEGDFLTDANWSSGIAPTYNGAENDIYYFGGNTAYVKLTVSSSLADFSNLYLNNSGTLTVNDGAIINLKRTDAAANPDGEFRIITNNSYVIQNGGTVSIGALNLSWNSSNTYEINGGLLESFGNNRIQSGGGSSTFLQTGGTVKFIGNLTFNTDASNPSYYKQSGGLYQGNNVYLGSNRTSAENAGTWELKGSGSIALAGQMRVGADDGAARNTYFLQSGTTSFAAYSFVIGNGSVLFADVATGTRPLASVGYYSLSSSLATATITQNITVGNNGATGIVTLSDGTLTGGGNLTVGNAYRNFNGTINGENSRFYTRASGSISQTGGAFNLINNAGDVNAYIGYNGGLGYYELSNGTLTMSAPNNNSQFYIGSGVQTITETALPLYVNTSGTIYEQRAAGTYYMASEGRFVQTGGTVALTGNNNFNITVGTGGGKGSYELSDGLLSGKALTIGYGASNGVMSSGSFNVSGGEVRLTGNVVVGQVNNGVINGVMQCATGRFVQSSGTVTVGGEIQIGLQGGDGSWEMTGGYLQGSGAMTVGYHGNGTFDTAGILPVISFTQTGGTTVINNNIRLGYYNETNSASVLGVLNVGGDASFTANDVQLSNQTMTHGQVNLNGGKLAVNRVYVNNNDAGSGLLFSGGTLAARQANGNFLTGFVAGTVVTDSVGTIDNSGFNISLLSGIGGSGGMVFSGSGQTTTYGVSTYTGTTQVKGGGVLLLTNSATLASRDFVVEAGSRIDAVATGGLTIDTLSGGGTVWGKMKFTGAQMITPGDSGIIGTLTLREGLSVSAGSEFNFLLGDTSNVNSMLKLTGGTFDYTGAANGLLVNFSALSALAEGDYTYTLIDAGSAPLTLSNFLLGAYDNSIYDNPLLDVINNQLVLTFSVIPEPSTLALIVTGGALLFILRRRR